MIITNIGNILQARSAIETLTKAPLSAKKSYEIAKMLKALTVEFESFEAARVDAVKRYGVEQEDGNFSVDPNNQDFIKEINELVGSEISIDRDPIDLSAFVEQINLSVAEILSLEPFFNFE